MSTHRHLFSSARCALHGLCLTLLCLGGMLSTLPAQQTTAQAYGSPDGGSTPSYGVPSNPNGMRPAPYGMPATPYAVPSPMSPASSPYGSGASNPYGSTASELQQKGASALDYLIREGDMVQVSVFNEPELAAGGRVRKDGSIHCPLIGSVKIQGLSQMAAARLIETEYRKDYLVHPEVNLFISFFALQHVTILGQVQRPGSHELPVDKELTILQVLGLAGGPTRIANLKKVLVKRRIAGQEKIFKVDVQAMSSGSETMMFYIHEDDVITVPESFF